MVFELLAEKFVLEVAKESGERYLPKSVYGTVCGI